MNQPKEELISKIITDSFILLVLLSKGDDLTTHTIGGGKRKEEDVIWELLYKTTGITKGQIKTMIKQSFPSEKETLHIIVFYKKH